MLANLFFWAFGYVYGWYLAITVDLTAGSQSGINAAHCNREVDQARVNEDVAFSYITKGSELMCGNGGLFAIAKLSCAMARATHFFTQAGWNEERIAAKVSVLGNRMQSWIAAYDGA